MNKIICEISRPNSRTKARINSSSEICSSEDQLIKNNSLCEKNGPNQSQKIIFYPESSRKQAKDKSIISNIVPKNNDEQIRNIMQIRSLNSIPKKKRTQKKIQHPPSNPNDPSSQSSSPSGIAKLSNLECSNCNILKQQIQILRRQMEQYQTKMEESDKKRKDQFSELKDMMTKVLGLQNSSFRQGSSRISEIAYDSQINTFMNSGDLENDKQSGADFPQNSPTLLLHQRRLGNRSSEGKSLPMQIEQEEDLIKEKLQVQKASQSIGSLIEDERKMSVNDLSKESEVKEVLSGKQMSVNDLSKQSEVKEVLSGKSINPLECLESRSLRGEYKIESSDE